METGILILVGIAVVGFLCLLLLFRLVWRVAEPNEALIISGLGAHRRGSDSVDSLGFKIVVGRGTAVIPGFQTVRRLALDIRGTNLQVHCVSIQGIPLAVRGVVAYKVGDDFASIANAARRFLDQQKTMNDTIHEVFAGHLRAIVGGITIENMLHDRETLTGNIRSSLADDMSKLGLVVDSLQIQEIDDESGYIVNLGKPHAAAIASKARIAEAERDQEATQAEQAAVTAKTAAWRDSQIKQAGYQAEVDQAKAKSSQAGPLAEATARQEVVVQETRAAELDADLSEKRLQSQVRKPADAKAYEQRTLAEAERDSQVFGAEAQAREVELRARADATRVKAEADAAAMSTKARGEADAHAAKVRGLAEAEAVKARGLADAEAVKAKGLAEAEAIEARAQALAENQEAVVAQQLAENWPAIVEGSAKAFAGVDNMVVLNGADGVADMLAKVLTMGGAGLGVARQLLNGETDALTPNRPRREADGERQRMGSSTSRPPT